jgi:heme exporter protein B
VTYLGQVYAIVWKDLLLELRTRERIAAMGAFAVLAGVLFNYSIDATIVRPQDIASGLIWMTLVFGGLLGIGRTFHLEAQDGAFQGVLTSPASKDAVFLGKTVANFVLLYLVALLVVAVFTLFFGLKLGTHPLLLAVVLALGAVGFVALGTLFSAVSSGTHMGETLLPILVFPLLVPVIIYGVSATSRLLAGRPVSEIAGNLRMLAAFAVLAVFAGAALFRFVVEE